MKLKNDPERVWEKDGWELWMKKQNGYVELHVKRPQKDFRIHSGRMGQHGVQVRFSQDKKDDQEALERKRGSSHSTRRTWLISQGKPSQSESALEILRQRYARGEINKEEFEAKKRDLS